MTSFVKTTIPVADFQSVIKRDGYYVAHFNEVMQEDQYDCVECITTEEPDLDALKAEYAEVKAKQDLKILNRAKRSKLAEITDYDTSDSVNSFILNGNTVWLPKDTRVGLMNSTTIEKNAGKTETTLWFDGVSLTINCDTAIQALSVLELYALECYNVTAKHKANVQNLTSIEDVENYDYTTGYPEKLSLTL